MRPPPRRIIPPPLPISSRWSSVQASPWPQPMEDVPRFSSPPFRIGVSAPPAPSHIRRRPSGGCRRPRRRRKWNGNSSPVVISFLQFQILNCCLYLLKFREREWHVFSDVFLSTFDYNDYLVSNTSPP
jgi:hypothetical protein